MPKQCCVFLGSVKILGLNSITVTQALGTLQIVKLPHLCISLSHLIVGQRGNYHKEEAYCSAAPLDYKMRQLLVKL